MNRTKEGRLQADPERFPSGIKSLADYVSQPFSCLLSCLQKETTTTTTTKNRYGTIPESSPSVRFAKEI